MSGAPGRSPAARPARAADPHRGGGAGILPPAGALPELEPHGLRRGEEAIGRRTNAIPVGRTARGFSLAGGCRRADASLLLAVGVLLAAATGACGPAGPGMNVSPEVRLAAAAPATGPLEVTYVWRMAADARPVTRDYRVFTHFLGPEGELLWQDDHEPEVPTSAWRPGQSVEYTRIGSVPASAPPGRVSLVVGLCEREDPRARIRLAGQRSRKRESAVGSFEALPADQLPLVVYDEGWYDPESAPGGSPGESWRWCQREARCALEVPGRPCSLYLEAQAPVALLRAAQEVSLELDGTLLATLEFSNAERSARKVPLPDGLTRGKDFVELVIRMERTVLPAELGASGDDRELGLKVHRLAVY